MDELIMKNKKGVIASYIFMIYRLVLISLVALVILGISSTAYSYDINTRDSEARILARELTQCIIEKDIFNEPNFKIDDIKYSVLDFCEIQGSIDHIYVSIEYEGDSSLVTLEQGDSGSTYVREIVDSSGPEFAKYQPGYYNSVFTIDSRDVNIEVYVNVQ